MTAYAQRRLHGQELILFAPFLFITSLCANTFSTRLKSSASTTWVRPRFSS